MLGVDVVKQAEICRLGILCGFYGGAECRLSRQERKAKNEWLVVGGRRAGVVEGGGSWPLYS